MRAPTDETIHELENWLRYLHSLEKEISETFMDYHPMPKALTRPIEVPALFKRLELWQASAEGRLERTRERAKGGPGGPLDRFDPGSDHRETP